MRKSIFILVFGALLAVSCKDYDEPYFLENSALTYKNEEILDYDELNDQIIRNVQTGFYGVVSDDAQSYIQAEFSAYPTSEGQKCSATLTWKAGSNSGESKLSKLSFEVVDVDRETGELQLWDSNRGVGLLVKNF